MVVIAPMAKAKTAKPGLTGNGDSDGDDDGFAAGSEAGE